MNVQQIEYAIALSKHGNFTSASKALGITQPALSLQIKKLEEEIEVVLFDRSSNPIQLTKDGKKFLIKAEEVVTAVRNLKDYAFELQDDYSGNLKIGIIPTLSPYLTPLFSSEMSKAYPLLSLEIEELLTEQVLEQLRAGNIDVGIISTPIDRSGFVTDTLFYERFYLYQNQSEESQAKEIISDDIAVDDIWLLEEGNCFRDQINDICSVRKTVFERQFSYRCNSIDSLIRIVDHHGGSTILPELTTLSLSEDQEDNLLPIVGKVREVGLVTNRMINKARFIELLKEYILKNIPQHMQQLGDRKVVDPGIKEL